MTTEKPTLVPTSSSFDINKLNYLLMDIRTVGDLLICAKGDELLSSTVSNAGNLIERAARRAQELVSGGAA